MVEIVIGAFIAGGVFALGCLLVGRWLADIFFRGGSPRS